MSDLLIRNDNDFRIVGFRDTRNPDKTVFLNAATTATWELRTLRSPGGTQVATGTMEYVTGSNGEYVGGLASSVELEENDEYWLHIVLVEGDVNLDIEDSFTAQRRIGRSLRT